MDRTQRKSERLANKHRRVGGSSREMGVGEALDADTYEVDTTNLIEPPVMNNTLRVTARKKNHTPGLKGTTNAGKKRHSRAGSKHKTQEELRERSKTSIRKEFTM